jgi:hypothetical protein
MALKTLPFKYKPIGDEYVEVGEQSCGIIELPKYGSVIPAEKIFIDEHTKDMPDTFKALCNLVEAASKASGKLKKEIWVMVQNNEILDLLQEDPEGFMELRKVQEQVSDCKRVIIATALLKYRVPGCQEITIEDVTKGELVHPKMLKHLEDFYLKELNGWEETVEEVKEEIDEDNLKKVSLEASKTT